MSRKNLRKVIAVNFCMIFIVLILIITLISCITSYDLLINRITQNNIQLMETQTKYIDILIDNMMNNVQLLAGNRDVVQAIKNKGNNLEKIKNVSRLKAIMYDIHKFNKYIKDIIIIDEKGQCYAYTGEEVKYNYNFLEVKWIKEAINLYDNKFKANLIGIHPQDYYKSTIEERGEVISLLCPIMDIYNINQSTFGLVLVNIRVNKIKEFIGNTSDNINEIIMLDNNDSVLYENILSNSSIVNKLKEDNRFHNETDSFYLRDETNKKYLVTYAKSQITQWKMISVIPNRVILEDITIIIIFIIIVALIGIIFVIILSKFTAQIITKPLQSLRHKMLAIGEGDLSIKLYDDSSEEIEVLTKNIDFMIDKINKLNREIYLYDIKSKEALIKAMQGQINPHFLYNTLQTIKAMAILEETNNINKLTTKLGRVLRYSYSYEELVTLSDEFSNIEDYIEVYKYRYPEKVLLHIEYDNKLKGYMTIKFIIQPIIENILMHGVGDRERINIFIKVKELEKKIKVEISDDGIGIKEDILINIRNELNKDNNYNKKKNIGLVNVNGRVKLKFGEEYGIHIFSKENTGTLVELLLPIIRERGL